MQEDGATSTVGCQQDMRLYNAPVMGMAIGALAPVSTLTVAVALGMLGFGGASRQARGGVLAPFKIEEQLPTAQLRWMREFCALAARLVVLRMRIDGGLYVRDDAKVTPHPANSSNGGDGDNDGRGVGSVSELPICGESGVLHSEEDDQAQAPAEIREVSVADLKQIRLPIDMEENTEIPLWGIGYSRQFHGGAVFNAHIRRILEVQRRYRDKNTLINLCEQTTKEVYSGDNLLNDSVSLPHHKVWCLFSLSLDS